MERRDIPSQNTFTDVDEIEVRVLEGQVLRKIVVKGSEAGQVLRGKIPLGKKRIASEQRIAMGQILVEAEGRLVGKIAVGAQVQVIVGVGSRPYGRRPHAHAPHPHP